MLQSSGSGHGSFLGHMAYDEDSYIQPFRDLHETAGHFSHLCHAARNIVQLRAEHGLDRVDHRHIRTGLLDGLLCIFQIPVGKKQDLLIIGAQPDSSHFDLRQGLLAGHI